MALIATRGYYVMAQGKGAPAPPPSPGPHPRSTSLKKGAHAACLQSGSLRIGIALAFQAHSALESKLVFRLIPGLENAVRQSTELHKKMHCEFNAHKSDTSEPPSQPLQRVPLTKSRRCEAHPQRKKDTAREPHENARGSLHNGDGGNMRADPIQEPNLHPVPAKRRPQHQKSGNRPHRPSAERQGDGSTSHKCNHDRTEQRLAKGFLKNAGHLAEFT